MWGLLLVGLFIELWDLVRELWPLLVAVGLLYLLWRWVVLARDRRAREIRERLRHEQARREIDRIALETRRAMYEAALGADGVIEGTAVDIEVRRP